MSEQQPHLSAVQEAQPSVEEFEYQILVGHRRTDGLHKTDEQLRMEYIQRTDSLIYAMTDGVDVENKETGEMEKKIPDVVIWLDKSARPLAWLTKELWPRMAADPETGEVPQMPAFKFLNIDREQWINKVDPEAVGYMDIDRVDQSVVRSLRSVFVSPTDKENGLTEEIDTAESVLDNKTVLIIDEVYSTGRTMDIAKKFVSKAFPTAQVAGTYWMRGIAVKDGATGNRDIPVWYDEKVETGRGVANRNDIKSGKSLISTQRLGAWFLSTRFAKTDEDALQLRKEFKHLAQEPDVPVLPSFERPDKLERMSALNNGLSVEAVMNEVRAIKGNRRY